MMKRSYFNNEVMGTKVGCLRKDRTCPEWLIEAIVRLSENVEAIPVEEDEQRYTVEYIYPH